MYIWLSPKIFTPVKIVGGELSPQSIICCVLELVFEAVVEKSKISPKPDELQTVKYG